MRPQLGHATVTNLFKKKTWSVATYEKYHVTMPPLTFHHSLFKLSYVLSEWPLLEDGERSPISPLKQQPAAHVHPTAHKSPCRASFHFLKGSKRLATCLKTSWLGVTWHLHRASFTWVWIWMGRNGHEMGMSVGWARCSHAWKHPNPLSTARNIKFEGQITCTHYAETLRAVLVF